MSEVQEPIAPALFNLAAKAVEECFVRIRDLELAKKYIGMYINWPQVSLFKNGMPHFHIGYTNSAPTDYTQVFRRWTGDTLIDPDQMPSIQAFLQFQPPPENLK